MTTRSNPPTSLPQPTLRELCTKATPGPWGHEYSTANTAYEIAPLNKAGELDWDREIAMTADGNLANAQLIARCNPQTVLKVYEALESARLDNDPISQPLIREALSLLDGKATP